MNEYLTVTVIIMIVLAAASTAAITSLPLQAADVATTTTTLTTVSPVLLVPIAVSADNIYVAWSTNKTGNYEVMFRASTDDRAPFTDKII
jgi:hypothetical protein